MNILVFGQTGQVACSLRILQCSSLTLTFLSREDADLSNGQACAEKIAALRPNAVINAAAWTAVEAAEHNRELVNRVNGRAPVAMAGVCAVLDIPFVHISTDYVFSGTGTKPWQPEDPTNPVGVYGRSKRIAEEGIIATGGRFVILRTSWVFSPHGNNFMKTILRLGGQRDTLSVVEDQIGGPTYAPALADVLIKITQAIVDGGPTGIYHFSGAPDTSWADFAEYIFKIAAIPCRVERVPSSAYPSLVPRPPNSRMDCTTLETDFGLTRLPWKDGVVRALQEME